MCVGIVLLDIALVVAVIAFILWLLGILGVLIIGGNLVYILLVIAIICLLVWLLIRVFAVIAVPPWVSRPYLYRTSNPVVV